MKIGVIQASSQRDINPLLYSCVKNATETHSYKVINFGVFPDEISYSYTDIAIMISLLIASESIDFIVTGCSSGQGMMLACNSLPGIICGYVPTPLDAYLFGRINNGNVVSLPLGLNFGWAGELNLQYILEKLFQEPFGAAYPPNEALRKKKDAQKVFELNLLCKRNLVDIFPELDYNLITHILQKKNVIEYILFHGTNKKINELLTFYLNSSKPPWYSYN